MTLGQRAGGGPRTRKRHQREHRPQRPTERSDPTQHAKGRAGDCPGPRKETTTGRTVTQGGGGIRLDPSPTQTAAGGGGGARAPGAYTRVPLWAVTPPHVPSVHSHAAVGPQGGGGALTCRAGPPAHLREPAPPLQPTPIVSNEDPPGTHLPFMPYSHRTPPYLPGTFIPNCFLIFSTESLVLGSPHGVTVTSHCIRWWRIPRAKSTSRHC